MTAHITGFEGRSLSLLLAHALACWMALACGGVWAQSAPAPQPRSFPPITARLLLREGDKDAQINLRATLLGRTSSALLIQGTQAGAPSRNIDKTNVLRCEFEIEFDRPDLTKALQNNDWAAAVRTLAPALRPAFPYLDLAENNAFDLVMDLGMYMTSSATRELRAAEDDAARTRARQQYAAAYDVFRYAGRADWTPLSHVAILKGCLAQLAQGEDEAAANSLMRVVPPATDDDAYGHYWLAQGELLRRAGKSREALEAIVKSVVFANKDVETFPAALLLAADCYQALNEHHRARDVYYEVAVLFTGTDWAADALLALQALMDSKTTLAEDKTPLEYVFFNVNEDMNKLASALLAQKGVPRQETSNATTDKKRDE